jgi:hypothetical protein
LPTPLGGIEVANPTPKDYTRNVGKGAPLDSLTFGAMGAPMTAKYLPTTEPGALAPEDGAGIIQAWLRLPSESETFYAYFCAYQAQGYREGYSGPLTTRSVADLERQCHLQPGALAEAYRVYQWEVRAGAWDREVQRRFAEFTNDDSKAVKASQMRLARKARNLGEIELDKRMALAVGSKEPTLTTKEALALADWGAKLERGLSDGVLIPSDLAATKGVDLGQLETAQLEELHNILKKAQGK